MRVWLPATFGPVAITWLLVVSEVQLLENAGTRTARLLAGLLGFESPELGVNVKVEARARTFSVQVLASETMVRVWAEVQTQLLL